MAELVRQEEGETVAHYVALSPDGNDWSFHPLPQSNFAAETVQWAYGNGRYVGGVSEPLDYDGPDELMPGRIFVFCQPGRISGQLCLKFSPCLEVGTRPPSTARLQGKEPAFRKENLRHSVDPVGPQNIPIVPVGRTHQNGRARG